MEDGKFTKEERRAFAEKKRKEKEERERLIEQQLPNDPNAEAAVLSAMLKNGANASYVLTYLKDTDFYRNSHKVVFRAMKALFEKNVEIDGITLTNELKKQKKEGETYEEIGGFGLINQLLGFVLSGANLKEHVKIVSDKSILRRLIKVSDEITRNCMKADEDVQTILDNSEQLIYDIAENPLREAFGDISKEIQETIKVIEKLQSNKKVTRGIETLFNEVDDLLGGLKPGQLIILAARPAVGKSAFATNIALNAAMDDKVVAMFTMEMETQEVLMRMISAASKVPLYKMMRGISITNDELDRIMVMSDTLKNCKIYIDDDGRQTLNQIRARTRRLKSEVGRLDMVIIDYLQLMSADAKSRESRQQEISEISRGMKIMAKELGVPVLALSQLNRQVESREDKKPILADLRESGAIEQDADVVMFLFRESVYNTNDESIKHTAELLVKKNRHGAIKDIPLVYFGEYTLFGNAEKIEKNV